MDNQSDYEPMAFDEFNGLTKLQYAAIQICAGLSANPAFGHEMPEVQIAQMAVNQARALFAELNDPEQ